MTEKDQDVFDREQCLRLLAYEPFWLVLTQDFRFPAKDFSLIRFSSRLEFASSRRIYPVLYFSNFSRITLLTISQAQQGFEIDLINNMIVARLHYITCRFICCRDIISHIHWIPRIHSHVQQTSGYIGIEPLGETIFFKTFICKTGCNNRFCCQVETIEQCIVCIDKISVTSYTIIESDDKFQ